MARSRPRRGANDPVIDLVTPEVYTLHCYIHRNIQRTYAMTGTITVTG